MAYSSNHKGWNYYFLTYLAIICFGVVFLYNVRIHGEQHFSFLSQSFLQGKLYFTSIPYYWADTSPFMGHYYWPEGPLPAILLMPFTALFKLFHLFFYQGYLQFILVIGVFYLIYRISAKFKYSQSDSLFLAFAFTFSSVFLGVAVISWSWYFAQVLTTILLLLLIWEFIHKKRHFVLGVVLALISLTRITAFLAAVFVVLDLVLNNNKDKVKKLISLIIPIFNALILLSLYNYFRFGNIFEQGYSFTILADARQIYLKSLGLFSFAHLKTNIYYLFLSPPRLAADPWGMSIFATSPYFIYLFFQHYRDKLSKILIITVLVILIPILFYYGIGFRQFGYRYSLDFLPLLFLLLIRKYRETHSRLSVCFKFIIILSAFTNLYLLSTIY